MERQQPLEAVRDFLGPDTDFEIDRGIAGWMRPTATPGDGIEAGVGARAARSPWDASSQASHDDRLQPRQLGIGQPGALVSIISTARG